MKAPESYSYQRYLGAKRTVDDRALHGLVWQQFASAISGTSGPRPRHILEVACGTGSMLQRLVQKDPEVLSGVHYVAIDQSAENLEHAQRRVKDLGLTTVELVQADVFEWLENSGQVFDGLVACAFLDLVGVARALPPLVDALAPGGFCYLPIHFDGLTVFEPTIDVELDRLVAEIYHKTMDQRVVAGQPSGDSRTGRHLFRDLVAVGLDIVEAGASDWVVFPRDGGYPHDEAYFLHFLVDTVRGAVLGSGQLANTDQPAFRSWVAERHKQVERAELVFLAHQLDFFCRKP